ncbi:MAG: ABC transporter substrate-binding protein [Gammaproteobacteria bacterium]|jgi:iron complex transport system substrate-binding protein|nr:ABC transporter substrate-binding protein [Gammaproteobacteria bacterium]MBT4451175.1 ABC transporter substrate-binding protein [Gammaproteobacteria bacterium]MBT6456044.1 ABC transporter substrate-binding protein [Gammaproteobacteria bacterium]MBT6552736.1 ABC transporter substrate-binding protein [Gammaproteobacteria bacterium]
MKKQTEISIVKSLIYALFLFFSAQSLADQGQKIVSLDLCTDWMLLKYAHQSQSITYSPLLYRYKVDWVPNGLPVHDGSLEQLLEINPDLVMTGEFNATLLTKRLKQLGIKTEIMPLPLKLRSIIDYTNTFKSLVQIRKLQDLPLSLTSHESNGKKLLLLGPNGIGTGTGTLENDIITKSGWSNYIKAAGFVNLDLEKLVIDPPDAVLWSKPVSNSLANLFARHRVLKEIIINRKVDISDSWRWQCPGPWTFDLITELAAWKNH